MSQRKIEKGVFEMTDGIGKIGGSNNGLGASYFNIRQDVSKEQEPLQPQVQPEVRDVNPDEVFRFIENAGNIFVPQQKTELPTVELSQETIKRIQGYMANFETTLEVAKNELGSEELALLVMDIM